MYNDFYLDLSDGKRGEKLVSDALTARGHTVIDLSDDAAARYDDIDMRLYDKSGNTTTLEVKNDIRSNSSGNVFIEYENGNNKSHNYKGWYCYTKARYLAFVQEAHKVAHIVSIDELKQNIKQNSYRTARSNNAAGFLMPVAALQGFESYFCLGV